MIAAGTFRGQIAFEQRAERLSGGARL